MSLNIGHYGARRADRHLDVALASSWDELPGCNWIVTNPPFSLAPLIVPLAFQHARVGTAMLLRKSYTESCLDRQDWLLAHKQHLANQIFLPRISFTGDGKTDNVACDWYVWTKERAPGCQVDWVLRDRR